MIRIRRGDPLTPLVASYNALRGDVARSTGVAKYHAGVTSNATTGDALSPASTPLLVTAADATTTATGVALANQLRTFLLVHMRDAISHKVADSAAATTLAAVAAATDDATTQALALAIQTAWNGHNDSITLHFTADSADVTTTINSAATAWTAMNSVKAAYNTHIQSAPAGHAIALVDP